MGYGIELAKAAGAQATGSFINEGMGLLLAGPKRNAQAKTARKLQNIQIEGQKEMTDYNTMKQLQMWKETNYPAQIEMMKEAGLNPGLMYGMGGGGGATTSIQSGNVGSQQAHEPSGSRGSEGMGLMIGQMGLIEAQRKNIDADTKLKLTEAAKKEGVDTELGKAQTSLAWVQHEIAQVQASVSRQTVNEQMKAWENIVDKGTQEIENLKVDTNKKQQEIQNLKSEVALNAIKGALMKAQESNTNQDTKLKIQQILESEQRIKTMAGQLILKWTELERTPNMNQDMDDANEDWNFIKDLIPGFLIPIGKGFGTHTPIKGFSK